MSGNNTRIHNAAAKIAAPVKNGVRNRLRAMLVSRRNAMWLVAAISCCAALVVAGITMRFSKDAAAMNTPVLVLDCHFAGDAAHTHVADCYDADGKLVCPLQERALHTHTAACYDANGTLICGKEELTQEHVHGAGCFLEVRARKEVPGPIKAFQQQAGDLTVSAIAPYGAFPVGTTMSVSPVDAEQVVPAVEQALADTVDKVTAVDITFHNARGTEVQPSMPIDVSMVDTSEHNQGQPVVLHMNADGEADIVAQSAGAAANDEVRFTANKFSVYVMAIKKLQQTLTASDGRTYDISVTYTEEAGLPDGAELSVREITEWDNNFTSVFNRAKEATTRQDGSTVTSARFFDITIVKDGVVLEPLAPVEVSIVLNGGIDTTVNNSVVHLTNQKTEVLDAAVVPLAETDPEAAATPDASAVLQAADPDSTAAAEITFTAESFSIYGVVSTTIERSVLASDGHNYKITVTCSPDAQVPGNADLVVTELEGEAYNEYLARTAEALGVSNASYARIFDITIVDSAGNKIQPAAPVAVSIELLDGESTDQDFSVVHFADDAELPDEMDSLTDGTTVSFNTTSFSVYAIVEAIDPGPMKGETVKTLEELATSVSGGYGFYLSINRSGGSYFTNSLKSNGCFYETSDANLADEWYFEVVDATANTYRIYTYVNDVKQYIKNVSDNNVSLVGQDGTIFEVTETTNNRFFLKKQGENKWLQHSNGGDGIRFYTTNNTPNNDRITITYATEIPRDPYGLDGKSYGIAYHNESAAAAALMAETKDAKHLVATEMLMRPDVLDNEGILLVAEDTDISWWTFECDTENHYYVSTVVDGATKYLTLTGDALTLEDAKSENALITITHGTGTNSGKYRFGAGEYAIELNLSGNDVSKGFWGSKTAGDTAYLNLVKESVLTDDDFKLYTAKKVSVSDTTNVYDGQQVVIYTRVWNDTTKRYEFYAVDSDGSLVRCYDTGDNIEWIGSQVNTALWDFTEYLNSEGEVSYYYELQNTQYGTYIAPQVTGGQVLSNSTIGINLNGRRYGENYTTIIAWDDDNYAYAGLKVEDGHVVACPLSEADDFYFAVMNPVDTGDKLSEVETIDSSAYGITMKIIDFNNDIRNRDGNPASRSNGRDVVQTEFFGYDSDMVGLLSTDLGEDGYPTIATTLGSRTGDSLSYLFTGMTDVNHLFLKSIYNESGYFEYDSTSNFAHLNDDGTFTVYDQLGAITGSNATKNTRTHGQFMPYDQIEEGKYAYNNGVLVTNQTDVSGNDLPDTDPRKGEKLYDLGKDTAVDYFFGMEMEASFTQTKSGLDAWGHDIIFEFSGDDDFWFYVDGELVLDLGGVHRAMAGSVNFRTGEVVYNKHGNGGPGGTERTTLYEIFKANYEARGLSKAEIDARLADIFIQNDEGNYVFKDYSNHTMRMFYMERGAGASNLHMRFNLAAVKPGTFILSKQLSGTESASNDLIEFPYQVWYKSKTDSQFHLLGVKDGEAEGVHYNGTSAQVTHKESFTPAGGAEAYEHVFMLKPGQSAEVTLPEDAISYYVVECGVNPAVYDEVTANGTELDGTPSRNAGRNDYATSEDTLANRSELTYDNHVSPGAMRTLDITKRLYDSDGSTPLSYEDDQTEFNFRLYLGNENADAKDLPAANLYAYYVKDGDGNYCRWNAAQKRFVSLGITTYEALSAYLDTLTSAEKESIIFSTSMNGAISKIPADHTVEVRGLIVGTHYKVEERTTEIPKGYTRRLSDGYTRMDGGEEKFETDWYSDTIEVDESPEVEVRNQKGWGLTVNKVWSDKDFMETHDPIYFAVYLKGDDGSLTLVNNTVRQLPTTKSEVYYFFGELENKNAFAEYTVREVTVVGGSVDQDGVVTGYTSVTPIDDNGTLTIGGKPAGGEYREGYTYTVTYQPGEQTTQNENVRTDAVTNTRPGIELFKTDWDGSPLAGAKFTLVDATGANVAAASYTSDSEGKITTAYLSSGTYTLTETEAPRGFVVLDAPMTITVEQDAGGTTTVTVSGVDSTFYDVTYDNPVMAATITVKDLPNSFQVRKVDGSDEPIEGAHFELYPQVTDATGNKRKDYLPKPGYEDLVSDANGILAEVTMNLGPGTYYLTETQATEGFDLLEDDVCFTIGTDGTVVVEDPHASWLSKSTIDGVVSYKLAIPNGKMNKVSFKKVDVANIDHPLAGSEFDLYPVVGEERAEEPLWSGLTSGEDGMLADDGDNTVFELPIGTYHLVETKAPAGYNLKACPVVINVTADGVTYDEGTTLSSSGSGLERGKETLVYLLKVSNTSGYELPHTGGAGTTAYTMFGAVTMGASLVLFLRRRLHISW